MKDKKMEINPKKMEIQAKKPKMKDNPMKQMKLEKVVLSVGGTAENLEKGVKLLERLTGKKAKKRKTSKRIPSLGVRPGLEVGAMVTLRGDEAVEILKRLFSAVDNKIRKKQISENSFSFGIKEYIEIPGMQYQRDIGIIGFDISVAFLRAGKRVVLKKIKPGHLPKRQNVSRDEIADYLVKNFGLEVAGK